MNAQMIVEMADMFKALSEPTRLNLLFELKEGEMTVTQLAEASGTTLANVSKHLTFMRRAGIVSRRKSGNLVYYGLRNQRIIGICRHVCEDIQDRFARATPGATGDHRPPAGPALRDGQVDGGAPPADDIVDDIVIEQPRLRGLNGNRSEGGLQDAS